MNTWQLIYNGIDVSTISNEVSVDVNRPHNFVYSSGDALPFDVMLGKWEWSCKFTTSRALPMKGSVKLVYGGGKAEGYANLKVIGFSTDKHTYVLYPCAGADLVFPEDPIDQLIEERDRVARRYERESKRIEMCHRVEAFREIQGSWDVLSLGYLSPCNDLLDALETAMWMNTEGEYWADAVLCDGVEIFNYADLSLLDKDML